MNSRHQPKRDYKSIGFRLIYTLMLMMYLTSVFEFDSAIWSATRIDGIVRHYALVIIVTVLSVLPGVFFIKLFVVRHGPYLSLAGLTTVAQLLLAVFCLSIEIAGALYFSLLFCFGCVFLIGFKWINYEVEASRPRQPSQRVMVPVTQNEQAGMSGEGEDLAHQVKFIAKRSHENFKCIHGMSELKKRLFTAASEIVCQYNESTRHQHQQKGNTSSVISYKAARNGILLFGEPGNGKTYFVQALAGELGLPLIGVTYGDVASKWINDTTQNVVKVFQDAKAQAPCLLFLDEIDSFIQNRDRPPSGAEEVNKTTNTILTEIVDLRSHGVVLVGATNYFDQLDKAATREGRFDYKIEITPPDEEARYEILIDSFHQYIEDVSYCPDIIRKVTQRWEGFSVKRIQAVGEEVAAMTVEDQINTIDSHLLKLALRRVQGRKGQLPENTKSLDQLILPDKLRQQLNNIATRMKDFETVDSMGGTVPTGLLLFGAPGTGKTETARSLAKATDYAFLSTTGNDLVNNTKEIDRILTEAKDIRPCIIFIDEADDILAKRKHSKARLVTNKLLTAMDGAAGKIKDIVYIAATNHPDHIDPAALRGGRFSEKLFFPLPGLIGLTTFVQQWTIETKAHFAADITPGRIVGIIGDEVSIADAAAILQEAVNHMIGRSRRDGVAKVMPQDIHEARTTILRSNGGVEKLVEE